MKLQLSKLNLARDEAVMQKSPTDIVDMLHNQIAEIEENVNKIMQHKANGACIHSRVKWYEEGEKETKYFLGLEKSRSGNKTLGKIKNEKGELITDTQEILMEQKKFYKRLYGQTKKTKFMYTNSSDVKLTDEEKRKFDTPFTYEDFKKSLRSMADNKAPGLDGLTCAFYKMFF